MILPALWRYLLSSYVRMLLLSVAAFLAVMVVTRFKEIARFTALSGRIGKTLLFTAYQFPLILPIAIPLSSLIAAFLLFQKLSRTSELTAFRASGLSHWSILAPLLFASALFSIGNFSICAEIAPFCRRETKTMLYQETSGNPLLLLQRQQLVRLKDAYLDMEVEEDSKCAKDATVITYNESQNRLQLLQAQKLRMKESNLLGENVSLVWHLESKYGGFDSLVLENQESMSTQAPILSQFLKKSRPRLQSSAMSLRSLQFQAKLGKKKQAFSARVEILRRVTLSLAVFSFTLLGASFAISTERLSKQKLLAVLLYALSVLISYMGAKGLRSNANLAAAAFLLPHPLIWIASIRRLGKIDKGASV